MFDFKFLCLKNDHIFDTTGNLCIWQHWIQLAATVYQCNEHELWVLMGFYAGRDQPLWSQGNMLDLGLRVHGFKPS